MLSASRTTSPRLAGLALAALLVAGACSSTDDATAVSVNGATISTEAVETELQAIRGNTQYREIVEAGLARQNLDMTVSGEGEGSFDTAFVARLLSLGVYYQLLEQETLERGLPVTDDELEQSRPLAVASVGGDPIFAAFPVDYQRELIRRQALTRLIQERIAPVPAPEEVRSYYEANIGDYASVCVSHIFANPQQRGEAEARARIEDLDRQLAEGADFRLLAREQSDDPGAAPAEPAGSLGCGGRGRFIPEFEQAALTLPVGEVSDPVQTSAGFHLILVESRNPQPFEEVQAEIAQTLQDRRSEDFGAFVDTLTCEADVEVNPRYGTWSGACDDPEAVGAVAPPDGPVATLAPPVDPAPTQPPAGG